MSRRRERSREFGRIEGGRRERKGQEQEAIRTRKSLFKLKYFEKQELKMFLGWTGRRKNEDLPLGCSRCP